jgi:glycosyltransferase involved in cell wall biosynthesis
LCEKNDVQSLKNAIIKLYNNYDKYDPLKLRESIVRFSEKEVAGKAYEIYKEAICKK